MKSAFSDEREEDGRRETYLYEDGISQSSSSSSTRTRRRLFPETINFRKEQTVETPDSKVEIHVDVVLQYNDSYNDQVLCYTNTVHNPDGGTHLSGFRGALTRAINQYAKSNNLLKDKDPVISGDDVREGLTARDLGQAQRSQI